MRKKYSPSHFLLYALLAIVFNSIQWLRLSTRDGDTNRKTIARGKAIGLLKVLDPRADVRAKAANKGEIVADVGKQDG